MKLQTHCPNKMIVNNLPEDLHFIYKKDFEDTIQTIVDRIAYIQNMELKYKQEIFEIINQECSIK